MATTRTRNPKARPATMDHLRKKEPLQTDAPVILNDRVVKALEDANKHVFEAEKHLNAQRVDTPEFEAAQTALDEARAAVQSAEQDVEDATVIMQFRSIGRTAYKDLLDEHPPSEEEKAEAEAKGLDPNTLLYNTETFPQALVLASCVSPPDLTEEFVQEMFTTWNDSEVGPVFWAAYAANANRRVVELGNAFGGIPS